MLAPYILMCIYAEPAPSPTPIWTPFCGLLTDTMVDLKYFAIKHIYKCSFQKKKKK